MTQPPRFMHVLLCTAMLTTLAAGAVADSGSVVLEDRQWALTSSADDLPWADADQYCRDLELDDHRDWRLPTQSELETLHDPSTDDGITKPIELDTCCIWSSTALAERPAETGGPPGGDPEQYYWGFLFEGGTPYYSFQRFADGRALCVRDAE